jgi:hypothetical protein
MIEPSKIKASATAAKPSIISLWAGIFINAISCASGSDKLGYPKAALFGFCLALVAFNLYAVIMAALRAANPEVNIKNEVSEYYIAQDISAVYEGMVIAVDYEDWELFCRINRAQMAILLIYLAKQVNLKKFKKSKRGVKKTKPEIKWDKNNPHVSTFKLLLNPV